MKYTLITICRVIVGLVFIFSGLVKANDPHGLSYKMQEFFEIWHMSRFDSWTLLMSVLMNAFEIIAGFALLLGWRIKLFSWLLLLLILFFTFLTGYTYVTGKPTNCGCFGDCIPISSKTSFFKDLVLTNLIAYLFLQQKNIRPLFSPKVNTIAMLGITVLSFGMQWYTLNYLPFVDCLPYKKGNSIPEKMKMPANAIPDSTVISFVYDKDGQRVEFTADKFPTDFKTPPYKFISRYDKVVRKGKNNVPAINGFALTTASGVDSTSAVLSLPAVYLFFFEDFSTPVSKWKNDFEKIVQSAAQKNIPVYIVAASRTAAAKHLAQTSFATLPVFECDFTAIRTAARTNPCLYYIENGTVIDKWSYKKLQPH